MTCEYCGGTGRAVRTSQCGARVVTINCPRCVLGVTVRGTHEMLRPRSAHDDEVLYTYVIKSPFGA